MHKMLDRLTTRCCGRSLDWKNKTRPRRVLWFYRKFSSRIIIWSALSSAAPRARAALPANYTRPVERDVFNIKNAASAPRWEHKTARWLTDDWLPPTRLRLFYAPVSTSTTCPENDGYLISERWIPFANWVSARPVKPAIVKWKFMLVI